MSLNVRLKHLLGLVTRVNNKKNKRFGVVFSVEYSVFSVEDRGLRYRVEGLEFRV